MQDIRLAQLRHLLRPLDPWRNDSATEEIAINGPNAAWVWRHGRFERHECDIPADVIEDIAILAGALRRQDVGPDCPLLSCELPGGERMQAVLHPCVAMDRPSLTIRKPSAVSPTLPALGASGLFDRTVTRREGLSATDKALVGLYRAKVWEDFFAAAVLARKTILVCGENASGKTHITKALVSAIPLDARLITVEDLPEWDALPHPNRVALLYAKGGRDASGIGATQLVEAALRMRIGWLLVQELRDGAAAVAFMRARVSGHPGITTIHAPHAEAAFDALVAMIKETPSGSARSDGDIDARLRQLVDVVIHCTREGGTFAISEVWFAADRATEAVAA